MKYGFFGTQSVGKTTLLNALRSEPDLQDFKFLTNMTRSVQAAGFKIKESGDDVTQMHIARLHAENVILYDKFITDRTIIDCLAYTIYLYRRDKVSKETLEYVRKYADFLLPQYTRLFYLPIEFDNVEDGTRSIDPTFREEINDIMTDAYTFDGLTKSKNVVITKISGSVVKRTNAVYDIIKGF